MTSAKEGAFPKIPGFREIERILGEGAHGTVFLAVSDKGKRVALKIQTQAAKTSLAFQEAALLARIQNPFLIEVYCIGEFEGGIWTALEYVEGKELSKIIRAGELNERFALQLGYELSSALAAMHDLGVIHRDIKPRNILISPEGSAKLIDLGFATRVSEFSKPDPNGDPADFVGTLLYCSPEQTGLFARTVDERSDLYSLGAVLYEVVSGRVPYSANSVKDLVLKQSKEVPKPLKEICEVSERFASIIHKLLERDPDERYLSARGLMMDLRALIDTETVATERVQFALDQGSLPTRWIQASLEETIADLKATPFCGRNAELQTLLRLWEAMIHSNSQVIAISGEEGQGKSRLVAEFFNQLPQVEVLHAKIPTSKNPFYDAFILNLNSSLQDQDTPLIAFKVALEEWLELIQRTSHLQSESLADQILNASREGRPILASFSPKFEQLLLKLERQYHPGSNEKIASTPEEASQFTPQQNSEALFQFLSALAPHSTHDPTKNMLPLAVLVQSPETLDPLSALVLRRLALEVKRRALGIYLIVSDERVENQKPWFELAETKLHLLPLSPEGTEELIQGYLSHGKVLRRSFPSSLLRFIWERSRGNPFLVAEYLEDLVARGALRPSWETWQFVDDLAAKVQLPERALDLAQVRLKSLSNLSYRILAIAGTVGQQFDPCDVQEISACTLEELNLALESSLQFQIIRRAEDSNFAFTHPFLRQSLIDTFTQEELHQLHLLTISTLLKRVGKPSNPPHYWIQLTDHINASDPPPIFSNPAQVARCNLKVGHIQYELGNYKKAAFHLNRALEAHPQQSSIELDSKFYETLALSLVEIGQLEAGVPFSKKALELCKDPKHLPSLLEKMFSLQSLGGFVEIEEMIDSAKRFIPPDLFVVRSWTPLKSTLFRWLFPQFLRIWNFFNLSERASKQSEDQKVQAVLGPIRGLRVMFADRQRINLMLPMFFHTFFLKKKLLPIRAQASEATLSSLELALARMPGSALPFAEELANLLPKIKEPTFKATTQFQLANIYVLCGRDIEGCHTFEKAAEEFTWFPDPFALFPASFSYALSLIWRGKIEKLLPTLNRILSVYQATYPAIPDEISATGFYQDTVMSIRLAALALQGNFKEAAHQKQLCEKYYADKTDWKSLYWIYCGSLALYYLEQGIFDQSVDALDAAISSSPGNHEYQDQSRTILVPMAYLRFRQWKVSQSDHSKTNLTLALNALKRRAAVPVGLGHYWIIKGLIEFEAGRKVKFRTYFERAKKNAILADAPWVHFEYESGLASFYRAQTNVSIKGFSLDEYKSLFRHHAEQALLIARSQGWRGREEALILKFRDILDPHSYSIFFNWSSSMNSSISSTSSLAVSRTGSSSLSKAYGQAGMEAIVRLSLNSSETPDSKERLVAVLSEAIQAVRAERALLFLTDPTTGELRLEIGVQADGLKISAVQDYSVRFVKKVQLSERALVYNGLTDDQFSVFESVVVHQLRSMMGVPLLLKSRGNLTGVLYCDSRAAKGIFNLDDADVLTAIGTFALSAFDAGRVAQVELEKLVLEKDLEAQKKIKEAYDALELATRNMRAIFGSIRQGICTINEDLKITGEYSKYLQTLTSLEDLKDKSLIDLLFRQSSLNADQIAVLSAVVDSSIGEDVRFGFDLNSINLPREFSKVLTFGTGPERQHFFEVDWIPLTRSDGIIVESLMVTIRDVTLINELRSQAAKQLQELQIVGELLRLRPEQFGFFEETKNQLQANQRDLSEQGPNGFEKYKRNLHTIKGTARMLNLQLLTSEIHQAESALISENQTVQNQVSKVLSLLDAYLRALQKMSISFRYVGEAAPVEHSFSSIIRTIQDSLPGLARELNRPLPSLVLHGIVGRDLQVTSNEALRLWTGALNHLVRNSLDHGFPEDFKAAAEIHLDWKLQATSILFEYRDTGCGLDLAKIRKIGLGKGWIKEESSNEEVAQLIFRHGVSSRESVTETSGRGIGMDAFLEIIQNWGGGARIKLGEKTPTGKLNFVLSFWANVDSAGLRLR